MLPVRVGNKHLPEYIPADNGYDLIHPVCIQLIEYIVQQQQGFNSAHPVQPGILSQL